MGTDLAVVAMHTVAGSAVAMYGLGGLGVALAVALGFAFTRN